MAAGAKSGGGDEEGRREGAHRWLAVLSAPTSLGTSLPPALSPAIRLWPRPSAAARRVRWVRCAVRCRQRASLGGPVSGWGAHLAAGAVKGSATLGASVVWDLLYTRPAPCRVASHLTAASNCDTGVRWGIGHLCLVQ